jgi:hypothetical protein
MFETYKFCMISITKSWDVKFVMIFFYLIFLFPRSFQKVPMVFILSSFNFPVGSQRSQEQ